MPIQWSLLLSLVFALIVAIFSLANVEEVPVNFLFFETSVPLILLILVSAVAGALIVGLYGIFRQYRLQREIRELKIIIDTEKQSASKENAKSESTPVSGGDSSLSATEGPVPSERPHASHNEEDKKDTSS